MKMFLQAMHVDMDHGQIVSNMGGSAINNMEVNFDVKIGNGKIFEVFSPSHGNELEITKKNENEYSGATKSKISIQKDFIIKIKMKDFPLFFWLAQKSIDGYSHLISILPDFKPDEYEETNFEFIIIVDRSGSMNGSRMKYAKEAMKLFIKSLDEDQHIKFDIISFGSSYESFFGKSKKFNESTCKNAIDHISSMTANFGGTNIFDPIEYALKQKIQKGFTRQIFLLTDGEDSNTVNIINLVKKHSNTTRFFSFGIGNGINPILIDGVANASNGRAVFLEDPNTIQGKVLEQLDHSLQPTLNNVKINFSKSIKNVVNCSDEIKPLFNHSRSSQYYFSKNFIEDEELNISYRIGEKEFSTKVKPSLVSSTVSILAARRRIETLELKNDKKQNSSEIVKLGLGYSLVSSETSYLMTVMNDKKIEGKMEREVIPTIIFDIKPVSVDRRRKRKRKKYSRGGGGGIGFFGKKKKKNIRVMKPMGAISSQKTKPSSGIHSSNLLDQIRKSSSSIRGGRDKLSKRSTKSDTINSVNSLLLQASIKGVWKFSEKIVSFLNLSLSDVKKNNPIKEEDLWITALIIAYLRTKHSSIETQWKLIVKKSLKSLNKKTPDSSLLLSKASEYISPLN